jgi:hypothetical protein
LPEALLLYLCPFFSCSLPYSFIFPSCPWSPQLSFIQHLQVLKGILKFIRDSKKLCRIYFLIKSFSNIWNLIWNFCFH